MAVPLSDAFGQTHPVTGYGYDTTNDDFLNDGDKDSVSDYLDSGAETDVGVLFNAYIIAPNQANFNAYVAAQLNDVNKDGYVTTSDVTAVTDYLAQKPFLNPGTYPDAQYDVNGDGFFTPVDMLQFYNEFSSRGGSDVFLEISGAGQAPYYDINGDSYLTSLDYLMITNRYQED